MVLKDQNNHSVKVKFKNLRKSAQEVFKPEVDLVVGFLRDKFSQVEVILQGENVCPRSKILRVCVGVSGYNAYIEFSKTEVLGYSFAMSYRGVSIVGIYSHDKSYFHKLCEASLKKFIEIFDVTHGKK